MEGKISDSPTYKLFDSYDEARFEMEMRFMWQRIDVIRRQYLTNYIAVLALEAEISDKSVKLISIHRELSQDATNKMINAHKDICAVLSHALAESTVKFCIVEAINVVKYRVKFKPSRPIEDKSVGPPGTANAPPMSAAPPMDAPPPMNILPPVNRPSRAGLVAGAIVVDGIPLPAQGMKRSHDDMRRR